MTRVESDEPILLATAIRTRAVNQKNSLKIKKLMKGEAFAPSFARMCAVSTHSA